VGIPIPKLSIKAACVNVFHVFHSTHKPLKDALPWCDSSTHSCAAPFFEFPYPICERAQKSLQLTKLISVIADFFVSVIDRWRERVNTESWVLGSNGKYDVTREFSAPASEVELEVIRLPEAPF
jgi:hypothetical protein